MKAHSCAELAELRSAYVDGALGDADREQLLTHLVDCADCRRDVAELRHVRALLTGSADPGHAPPTDLSHRLVSIAGAEATEPLWTRPFRRTPSAGHLPSQRHVLHTRLLAGVLGCGLAVLTVLGVGYVSAPSATTLPAVDPSSQAVTEFTSVVSAFPLDGRVSIALQGRAPTRSTGGDTTPTGVRLPAKALSEARAVKVLTQAGQAGDELTYTAVQRVALNRDQQQLRNDVRISSTGGSGTRLTPRAAGSATVSTHIDADSSTRMVDADLIDRLAVRYALRGWKAQWYAGRIAYVIEAVEPTAKPAAGSLDGVAARWWVDGKTSVLLGQETYDGRGNLVVSSTLTDLRLGTVADDASDDHSTVANDREPRSTATLTLSRTAELRRDGWICAERLAGLPLLRLRTDRTEHAELVHLVYSDGLTTLSVVEQRGRLADAPAGATRNETLGAWLTDGMPTTASWTSGDVVLTAVTDGSRETLAAAVAALPHAAVRTPTTMERVRAGWSRILGR